MKIRFLALRPIDMQQGSGGRGFNIRVAAPGSPCDLPLNAPTYSGIYQPTSMALQPSNVATESETNTHHCLREFHQELQLCSLDLAFAGSCLPIRLLDWSAFRLVHPKRRTD